VTDGQNLAWIAGLYGITAADLMAWNYLTASSVIYPGDRLLLLVTPPATNTPTLGPPSETPQASPTLTPSPSPSATRQLLVTPTATDSPTTVSLMQNPSNWLWLLAAGAVGVAVYFVVRNQKAEKHQD
jgi:LysM repeat protein